MTYVYMLIEIVKEYISKAETFLEPFFNMIIELVKEYVSKAEISLQQIIEVVKDHFNFITPVFEFVQRLLLTYVQLVSFGIGIGVIILIVVLVIVAIGSDGDVSQSKNKVEDDLATDLIMDWAAFEVIKSLDEKSNPNNNDRNYFTR